MTTRRQRFADLIPTFVADREPCHLKDIYTAVEEAYPELVDAEVEPAPSNQLKWKHELRWELETLVGKGVLRRRKDLGRGMYSR